MKKHISIIALLFTITVFSGCKKKHVIPVVPAPHWTVTAPGKFPASMTAVVQVPESLAPYVQSTDEMAAFSNGECRGTGVLVKGKSVLAFFVLIHGVDSVQDNISFEYYNAWYEHLYKTNDFLLFTADGNYGTVDSPEVLDLKPVK